MSLPSVLSVPWLRLAPAGTPVRVTVLLPVALESSVRVAVLVPVANAYRAVLPSPVRDGIHDFLQNLNSPIIFANDVLQGQIGLAGDTVARFLPLWHETIAPEIRQGRKVLITAHGNSLRALVKYLDNVSEKDIIELNIPTGMALVYELDDELKPLNRYYLGDPEKVKAAMEAVAAQGKKK